MSVHRRHVLALGGGIAVALTARPGWPAGDVVEIAMTGNRSGSRVSFDPVGLTVRPGQTVRWTNRDPGNAHTATAYHPANADHPLRIPQDATPWDSDYLLPDEFFEVTLARPGVYDFFCAPHEHAGMVGRIVVGDGRVLGWSEEAGATGVPESALATFPPVARIVAEHAVRPTLPPADGG